MEPVDHPKIREDGYTLVGYDKYKHPVYLSPQAMENKRQRSRVPEHLKKPKPVPQPRRKRQYDPVKAKQWRKKRHYDPIKAREYRIKYKTNHNLNTYSKRGRPPGLGMSHQERRANINAAFKLKMETDPFFKMKHTVRTRIGSMIRKIKTQKQAKTEAVIGCSWIKLKSHLESQFTEKMTWENHGLKGWHIDHIIPLACATDIKGLEKLCHYTNLRPLWDRDNRSKGARLQLF
jgi:hypothetical protein